MENTEKQLTPSESEITTIFKFIEALPQEILAPTNKKTWRQLNLIEEIRKAAKELSELKSYAKQLQSTVSIASLIYINNNYIRFEKELCKRAYDRATAFNSASFITLSLIFVVSASFAQTLIVTTSIVYLLIFIALIIKLILDSRRYLQEISLLIKLEALLEMAEDYCSKNTQEYQYD